MIDVDSILWATLIVCVLVLAAVMLARDDSGPSQTPPTPTVTVTVTVPP